jgi:O-antigen/teichoic acid export membrane protein
VTATDAARRGVARLRIALDVPFVRNAYSLVGSVGATSGLGFVFWVVTARLYPVGDVGRASTLVATMLFLSSLSQLNLTNGFNRFVPTAGHRTHRLVGTGYLAAVATATATATVFVIGVDLWAPELSLLHDHWYYGAWFVGGTAVWTVFALQDAVLTGLGEARTVLAENVVYGVAKIGLLFLAAAAIPNLGAYAAWTLPLIPIIFVINAQIFRRHLPRRSHEPLEEIDGRAVRRYIGFDMVAAWMMTATIGLLPLFTLAILGAKASAYLYQSWTIAYTLYLAAIAVGMSLVTEASRQPERVVEYARRMIALALRIVAPLAIVIALGAPLILRLFGPAYANHATHLLQLLALSAIPNTITATYLSIARVQRRLRAVIVATGALAVTVLTLAIVLMPIIGVTGAGAAWLIGQTLVASVLLAGELRTVWLPYVRSDRWWGRVGKREPRPRSARAIASEGQELLAATTLDQLAWDVVDVELAPDDVRVAVLRSHTDASEAELWVGRSGRAADAVRTNLDGIRAARAAASPAALEIVPDVLAAGSGPRVWSAVSRGAGVDGLTVVERGNAGALQADLAARIVELHRATAVPRQLDVDLPDLLELPQAATGTLPTTRLRVRADETSLARLQEELRRELGGATVTAGLVHGNLWLGNVRATPEGRVTSLVHWERSRLDLPVLDLLHLVCTTRAEVEHRELGAVVRDVIAGAGLRDDEQALVGMAPGAGELSPRTAVLLMWLRHVQGYARHFEGSRPSHVWMSHNVHEVLESV